MAADDTKTFPGRGGTGIDEMFGLVTAEDRQRWAQMHQAREDAKKRHGVVPDTVRAGFGFLEQGVVAQMGAASIEDERGTMAKRVTSSRIEQSTNVEDDYEPEM